MQKFKHNIVRDIKEEREKEQRQEQLKKKYNVPEAKEQVLIVEKSNMIKFSVKVVATIIRTLCTITILTLAAIGLMTVIYPQVRGEFFTVISSIYEQLQVMIGG